MISVFVKEQKRYRLQDLALLFECSEEKVVPIVRKLKEYNVLKTVPASKEQLELSDLEDTDIEIADVEIGDNSHFYVFTFVGVIAVAGRILKCYPKYIFDNDSPTEELRQIIKVLEKYNSREQIIRMISESNDSRSFNLLAVLLFLLHDYYENGIYSNTEDIVEINGAGEILWEKTINETFTLISDNRPYYPYLQTKKRVTDDYDYFTRLHEYVLTRASKELADADLLEIFEINGVDLTDAIRDDFGDEEYILYRIDKELNEQFNTRKQLVLKTIYAFIDQNGSIYNQDCMSMFGSNSFNLVWEKVCAEILDNKLDTKLKDLDLPVELGGEYDPNDKLIDIIDHPIWFGKTASKGIHAKDTLIPDIISLFEEDDEQKCIIFDAKYYNLKIEKGRLEGQPGIESVTKQYLYQMAYEEFLRDHAVSYFRNCFLMPVEGDKIIETGYVMMPFLQKMKLEDIQIRLLPAKRMFKMYLENRKIDIRELHL